MSNKFSLKIIVVALALIIFGWVTAESNSQNSAEEKSHSLPEITKFVKDKDLQKVEGLLTFYLDPDKGKVWLEVDRPKVESGFLGEFLFVTGFQTGLGSNKLGLDRGEIQLDFNNGGDRTRLIALRRIGGKVFIEQKNLKFRFTGEDKVGAKTVRESFATSILWVGNIEAKDPETEKGLVDITTFFMRDDPNVIGILKEKKQGDFKLDSKLSFVDIPRIKVFPKNVEVETRLTFTSEDPGEEVKNTVPDANNVTLFLTHSLYKLPKTKAKKREFDLRVGTWSLSFLDFGSPIEKPLEKKYVLRYRLEKVDPNLPRSTVKNPIIFYVDSGIPEPIRGAVIEGVNWWREAFEEAGFINAFRTEILPKNINPLDARYNVIQWVHRSTRGWSYSQTISDPRTGEVIKSNISLGSLRIRQDKLIFEGLTGVDPAGKDSIDDPVQLSLWRIRQLAAHEVGHSLGLRHNFAASSFGGGASVMDYPAPLIGITPQGKLDFSKAYGVGVESWDKFVIKYLYSEFPPGADERADEKKQLDEIVNQGLAKRMFLLSDQDYDGGLHPLANKWDNGKNPVKEFRHVMKVRRIALNKFGERNLQTGRPLALIQETLAPIYFFHRYQLEAIVKIVGGLDFRHRLVGDGQMISKPISGPIQQNAIQTILSSLTPNELDLPDDLLNLLQPRPFGYPENNPEMFQGNTGPSFDILGAAATSIKMTIDGLLQHERAARLVEFHRRDDSIPSLENVLDEIITTAFKNYEKNKRLQEIRRVLQQTTVTALINLSLEPKAAPFVKWRVDVKLQELFKKLENSSIKDSTQQLFEKQLAAEIKRHLERPFNFAKNPASPFDAPLGPPIGFDFPYLSYCSRSD